MDSSENAHHWIIYNAQSKDKVEGLTLDQARQYVQLLKMIPGPQLKNWFAWAPGKGDWIKVMECQELTSVQPQSASETAASELSNPPEAQSAETAPSAEEPKGAERRRHPRFNLRLSATIVCGYMKFQTMTKDVSIGGLKLMSPIPWIPRGERCRVLLKYPGTNDPIEFGAKLFLDTKNPNRVQFLSADPRVFKKLGVWLEMANKRDKRVS